jgi:hypothetical protein
MKKILVLAGIVAAVFGVKKLMGGKEELAEGAYTPSNTTNGYTPEPQA